MNHTAAIAREVWAFAGIAIADWRVSMRRIPSNFRNENTSFRAINLCWNGLAASARADTQFALEKVINSWKQKGRLDEFCHVA